MRTDDEQAKGLAAVLRLLGGRGEIVVAPGDVAALNAGGDREVCYAVGGYDGWVAGKLKHVEMTAEEAAAWLEEGRKKR